MSKRIEYYSASWCQPCKVFGPVMDGFASDNESVEYIKISLDNTPEKAIENGVTAIPTIILWDGDKRLFEFIGAKPRPYLDKELLPLI